MVDKGRVSAGTVLVPTPMMGETVEERCRHLGVAGDGWPFSERQVGGDDDRGPFVEPADQVEEQLPAGLREGQIAEFIEHDEVEPGQVGTNGIKRILQS